MSGIGTQAGMLRGSGDEDLPILFGDTYVKRGDPNTNYSTDGSLLIKGQNSGNWRAMYMVFDDVIAWQDYDLVLTGSQTFTGVTSKTLYFRHLVTHIDPSVVTYNMLEYPSPPMQVVGANQYKEFILTSGEEYRYRVTPVVSGRLNLYIRATGGGINEGATWIFRPQENGADTPPRLEPI